MTSRRMFPIRGAPAIPWSVIAPCERQAGLNHGQTLERLAERGGLGPREAYAVLTGKRFRETPDGPEGLYSDLVIAIVRERDRTCPHCGGEP